LLLVNTLGKILMAMEMRVTKREVKMSKKKTLIHHQILLHFHQKNLQNKKQKD
jgi:hypothetical protein